jgi:hypothetical protein
MNYAIMYIIILIIIISALAAQKPARNNRWGPFP